MNANFQKFIKLTQEQGFKYTCRKVLTHLRVGQKNYNYYRNLPHRLDVYEKELCDWYKRFTGKTLDLTNPRTYNEKIQWLKLYDSTPLKTRLADKYLVRDYVKEKIGEEYLIPLLGVWDSFDEIDFDALPNCFVLKANHGSGWNIIVKDKHNFDKADAKRKFDAWMNTNFAFVGGFELHYYNIEPKIIAEQYLENGNDDLYDYKVFCFDGKAESILTITERKTGLTKAFHDLKWNPLHFSTSLTLKQEAIPKPKNLDLLISVSEKLSQGFAHVRVDFYVLNDGSIKFGELTFTPTSSTSEWDPPEQDRIYGELIKLPEKSPFPIKN